MVTGFETPGQRPPTLKNAADLSDSHEYAAVWTGQSNSRPWGYPVDGYEFAAELQLAPTGLDLTTVVIPNNATRSVGMVETLVVDSTVELNQWSTSTWLRLGTNIAPQPGYASVVASRPSALDVRWISLPTNNTTVSGYLVRENGKYSQYEHVRVLTPFTPVLDIQPPISGAGGPWFVPAKAPYPTPNAAVSAGGQRLTLPAPYTLPAAVTDFSDLAVFLRATRREGSDGFGISDIADATFTAGGAPTGHPVTTIVGQVFTFANTLMGAAANADLTGGYLLVDWESGGASKRSWARIASNTTSTFTTDAASWLGDGVPSTPATSAITEDTVTDEIIWTGHTFLEGDRVFFTGTAVPAGLTAGRVYFVRNPTANRFQVSPSMDHSIIDITGASTAAFGWRAWKYTAWIPHWKDNPNMWLPGPEFAYANEDQQPLGVFVHWRARGQVVYVHTMGGTPFDGVSDARFGALIPFGWRMGAALGKRFNVVALGINSTPMITGNLPNFAVYPGVVGWWDYEQYGFSLPLEATTGSLATRLRRLVEFIAPQALLAESSTRTLRYVAAAHVQGEADALFDAAHELYTAVITDYKEWLRDIIDAVGLSPFENGAKMPFVQPLITNYPWESEVASVIILSGGSGSASASAPATDVNGEVNNGIREAHTAEEFAGYVETDDLPKLLYHELGSVDSSHFSGQGFAVMGSRLAAVALELVEHALTYGSASLQQTNARLLRIVNLALLYIGQGARQITSLGGNTTEARLASTLLPEATTQLLSRRPWSWAMRREPATMVLHDDPKWLYAYVVPERAISPVAIIPPEDGTTVGGANLVSVLAPGSQEEFIISRPESFEIGRSMSGHRLLLTNLPPISADLSQPYFADGLLHPERLPRRPTLQYVDKVTDADRYSHNFATALSWLLASMMAPALVKGQEGETVAARCLQKVAGYLRAEGEHETITEDRHLEHRPTWIGMR